VNINYNVIFLVF